MKLVIDFEFFSQLSLAMFALTLIDEPQEMSVEENSRPRDTFAHKLY